MREIKIVSTKNCREEVSVDACSARATDVYVGSEVDLEGVPELLVVVGQPEDHVLPQRAGDEPRLQNPIHNSHYKNSMSMLRARLGFV